MQTPSTSPAIDAGPRRRAPLLALGLAGCAGLVIACSGGTTPDEHTSHSAAPTQAPAQGAMQAHIDPETGLLTDKPAAGEPALPGDVRIPDAPHVQKPSPVPGGGVMIDLRGKDEED